MSLFLPLRSGFLPMSMSWQTLRWILVCGRFLREYCTLGEERKRGGSRTGQRKLGCKAVSRIFSANFTGSSETNRVLFHMAKDITYVSLCWPVTEFMDAPRRRCGLGSAAVFSQFLELTMDRSQLPCSPENWILQSRRKICGTRHSLQLSRAISFGGGP